MALSLPTTAERVGKFALRAARALDTDRRPQRIVTRRNPMAPAAVRVERSSANSAAAKAQQTAVTMWFGDGPELPSPGLGSDAVRTAVRMSVGLVGVAALGAMTVIAAQSSAKRQRLQSAAAAHRLTAPEVVEPR